MKRLLAAIVAMVMMVTNINAVALAEGFRLPAGLTAIEEEAFAGVKTLRGLVALPENTRQVGARAFAGTDAFALDVPAGVERIAPQEHALTYIRLRGEKTVLADVQGIAYVFAPAGADAAAAAQWVDEACLKAAEGFYYRIMETAAELLCAVDNTAVPAQVKVPETVAGVPVTRLSAHAFEGCSHVTRIELPKGAVAAEGAFSACPDAQIIQPVDELVLTEVHCSAETITAGDTVTWTAQASGGVAPYQYQFAVYMGDTRIAQSSYSAANTYSCTLTDAGEYRLVVRVRDDDYSICVYEGDAFTVLPASVGMQVTQLTTTPDSPVKGDSITWTVQLQGGAEPYRYAYTLYMNQQEVAGSSYGLSNTFTAVAQHEGEYILEINVLDADNNSFDYTCPPVSVALAALEVTSLTADREEIQTEDTVVWTAQASGGLEPYRYAFTLTRDGLTVAQRPAEEAAAFDHTFLEAGEYALTVTVTDQKGSTAQRKVEGISVALRPVEVTSLAADVQTALTGDAVTWTAIAAGGDRTYTYAFSLYKDGEEIDFRAFTGDNTYTYTPEEAGEYMVGATVRDGARRSASAQSAPVAVTLRPLSIQQVSMSADIIKLGQSVTLNTQAIGGLLPLRYSYEIYRQGELLTASPYTLTSACTFTPEETGEYTFQAMVRDGQSTVVSMTTAPLTVYGPLALKGISHEGDHLLTGDPVTWTLDVQGGKGAITYDWYIYHNDELEYTQRNNASALTYAPMRAGVYTVHVDAVDEGGDTAAADGGEVSVGLHPSTPAEDFTYYYQNGSFCTITGYTGTDRSVVLPGESPDGHIVQYVGDSAFKNNTGITSVVFADSIESMGSYVFQGCTSLLNVCGGESLTNVGSYAFDDCVSLRTFEFAPATVSMGSYAFRNCTSLTTFTGWQGLKNIGGSAFEGLNTLRSIDLPSTVTSIDGSAFRNCANLVSAKLPEGLVRIGSHAFENCCLLTNVVLPDSLQNLDTYAFRNCVSITSINYPLSLKQSSISSPYDCALIGTGVTHITVPEGVTEIPQYTFTRMKTLRSITLPSTLKTIGSYAFYACSGLTDISIPDGVTTIESSAMSYCTGLISVTLPESLQNIRSSAFAECTGLKSVHLPDGLQNIDSDAFNGCTKLTEVNYPKGLQQTNVVSPFYSPFRNTAVTTLVVPEGVTEIPQNMFRGMKSLRHITLPGTMKTIGDHAFYGCSGLPGIEIPEGVTTIESNALSYCTGLISVTLPESLLHIRTSAFAECTELKSVHLPDGLQNMDSDAFNGCTKLTEVNYPKGLQQTNVVSPFNSPFRNTAVTTLVVPEGVTAIPQNMFRGMKSLRNITLPGTLKTIGDNAFCGCIGLPVMDIPEGVTTIGSNAFDSCTGLRSIHLPESLRSIGGRAFVGCTALESLIIPDGVQTLGYEVFKDCTKLTAVNYPISLTTTHSEVFRGSYITEMTVPEGVTVIPNYMFSQAQHLVSITLPSTLKSIDSSAFYACTALENVYMQEGLETLHMEAFRDCTSLRSVRLPDSVQTMGSQVFRGCTRLTEVNYPASLAQTYSSNYSPFKGAAVKNMNVPEGITAIPQYMFAEMTSLCSITLPSTLKTIDSYAFYKCTSLESIVIPDGVTTIGDHGFNRCSALKAAYMPPSVKSISAYAFGYCDNLAFYGTEGTYAHTFAQENAIPFNPAPAPRAAMAVTANGSAAGGSLAATVTAYDGAAPYRYNFMLYQDGKLTRQTGFVASNGHTFTIYEAGSYQVVANVKDYIGQTLTVYGEAFSFTDAQTAALSGRVLDDRGNPVEGAQVTIQQNADAQSGEKQAATVYTDADGRWTWQHAVLGVEYTVIVSKDGLSFGEAFTAVVNTPLGVMLAPLFALGTGWQMEEAVVALSGTVLSPEGLPVEGVSVSIMEVSGALHSRTLTDANGAWGVHGLQNGASYTVAYGENQMTVEPATVVVLMEGSKQLSAVAQPIADQPSDRVQFVMSHDTIMVGDTVTFEIAAPAEAAKVRLVVDGAPYQVIDLENGQCTYQRAFTKSGSRKVAFQAAVDGRWADISFPQTLTVNKTGELDAPVYADLLQHLTGDDLTLDWADVPHAGQYVVWLYCNQAAVKQFDTTESVLTIPAENFPVAGSYGVTVIATAPGYDQNSTYDDFEVVLKNYAFTLQKPVDDEPHVVGDPVEIVLEQSGGGYAAVKVEDPFGGVTWYPGTSLTADATYTETFTVPHAGVYTVTPYLYTLPQLEAHTKPLYTGTPVAFEVKGPAVQAVLPNGQAYTWEYVDQLSSVRINTNNAVEQVELYDGATLLGSAGEGEFTIEGNGARRVFSIPLQTILAKGKHVLKVKAKDTDTQTEVEKTHTLYLVEKVTSGAEVYAQAAVIDILSSPVKGKTVASALGDKLINHLVVIGDADDWTMVRTEDQTEGFVPSGMVAGQAWSGASGGLTITNPAADSKIPYYSFGTIHFIVETGLVVPEGAVYTLTLTPLVGTDVKTYESGVGLAMVPIYQLAKDEYTAVVTLRHEGQVLAQSSPVTFTLGDFSLEDSYKEWWKKEIAPRYTAYLKNGDPFYGEASAWYGWGGWFIDTNICGAVRPKIIEEAATLAYTQILQDFKDLRKDSTTNAENNWALTLCDEEAMRRLMLTSIGAAMLDETEKGSLALKEDLSNVDPISSANQHIAMTNAENNALFAFLRASVAGLKTFLSSYGLTPQGAALPEASKRALSDIADLLEGFLLAMEEAVKQHYAVLDAQTLLTAYAKEYARLMKGACDVYVDCLKETYQEHTWSVAGSFGQYVEEYIQGFENAKKASGSEDAIYQEAVRQMLNNTGYTPEMLSQMHETAAQRLENVFNQEFGCKVLVVVLNDLIKMEYEKNTGKLFPIESGIFQYDIETGDFGLNLEDLSGELLSMCLTGVRTRILNKEYTDMVTALFSEKAQEDPGIQNEIQAITERFTAGDKKTIKNQGNILKTTLEVVHSSWDIGVAIRDFATSLSVSDEQSKQKGIFDTQGLRLISTLKLRLDAQNAVSAVNYDWDQVDMDQFTVEQLDAYRQALVTITNYDTNIMNFYRNMRVINDQNGDKFTYDIPWLTVHAVDSRKQLIEAYREVFSTRPVVYDTLFR